MSTPLREFGKTGAIICTFAGPWLPVRPGFALHKSQSCYPLYLTTQVKNNFVFSVSIEKYRGY
jgi:hypothetical protein